MRAHAWVLCKSMGRCVTALHGPEAVNDCDAAIRFGQQALDMHAFGVRAQVWVGDRVFATLFRRMNHNLARKENE